MPSPRIASKPIALPGAAPCQEDQHPKLVDSDEGTAASGAAVKSVVRRSGGLAELLDQGAEIRRIMQCGSQAGSPPSASWLGVSPPTRATGAANPLVSDFNWKKQVKMSSHNNLQALREMDAHGVSFLRSTSFGDCRLLLESPEYGLLAGSLSDTDETCSVAANGLRGLAGRNSPICCQRGFQLGY
ncbi:hypothetical protein WJX72_004335 [[Myrmecia] bisecta]|uniref:Uncharacterized protein n=1 Tax=[Myrmecia] bisecta TaxID=41462 RepID=A0AAW1P7Q8_9CHLO